MGVIPSEAAQPRSRGIPVFLCRVSIEGLSHNPSQKCHFDRSDAVAEWRNPLLYRGPSHGHNASMLTPSKPKFISLQLTPGCRILHPSLTIKY